MRTIERLHRPEDQLLSFDQVKQHIHWLSGVVPVEHDICVNSCLAYTGPRETLDSCSHCGEPRYCPGTTKPQKRFTTIPMGPVIQALYSSPEVLNSMHYLENKLTENLACARLSGGILDVYDDTASGQACYDPGSDFSARLLTGYDYGTPQVSSHISHGQSPQSAEVSHVR